MTGSCFSHYTAKAARCHTCRSQGVSAQKARLAKDTVGNIANQHGLAHAGCDKGLLSESIEDDGSCFSKQKLSCSLPSIRLALITAADHGTL